MDQRNRSYRRAGIGVAILSAVMLMCDALAQSRPMEGDVDNKSLTVDQQKRLLRALNDRAGYAADIVLKWEGAARASGRWDMNYAQDLYGALTKLQTENLIAAGEAPTYEAMMKVIMTGKASQDVAPKALGDFNDDLVYTPITPCRIVDTRNAGGIIAANSTRTFDVDGSTFTAQGGINASCGIPFGVAAAVAMSIAVTAPDADGFFRAWGLGSTPFASVLNYYSGETIAVTSIVPVVPGAGNDFSLQSVNANAHAVIDVLGYYARPVATAVDCLTVTSAPVTTQNNTWTAIDADCACCR